MQTNITWSYNFVKSASSVQVQDGEEQTMTTFKIEPNENTLHGFFSRDLAPILTIDSGDTVLFKTIDAEWGLENFSVTTYDREGGQPPRQMAHTNIEGPMGHALCGPVFIRGAEPGMTL